MSDNGTENVNKIMAETLKDMNVDHATTSFCHLQSNAKVERFHRTLHDIMSKKMENDLTTWDMHLNQTLSAIRVSVAETTQHSPFFLMHNHDPVMPVDNILRPRRKYLGEEHHRVALENQHKTFTQVYRRIKKNPKEKGQNMRTGQRKPRNSR